MSEFYPEPKSLGGSVKIELNLSNYATKIDLRNARGVHTASKKTDLANLKSDVEKFDIDKLKYVPTN